MLATTRAPATSCDTGLQPRPGVATPRACRGGLTVIDLIVVLFLVAVLVLVMLMANCRPCPAPQRTVTEDETVASRLIVREQLDQRQDEARQHGAAVERLAFLDQDRLVDRGIDPRRSLSRVH